MLLLTAAATGCMLPESRLVGPEQQPSASMSDTDGMPEGRRSMAAASGASAPGGDGGSRAARSAAEGGGTGGVGGARQTQGDPAAAAGHAANGGSGKGGSADPKSSNKPGASAGDASTGSSSGGAGGDSRAAAGGGGESDAGRAGSGGMAAPALQFTLVDQEYTATSDNTEDSHFVLELQAGIPTDWTAPVDYRTGSLQIRVDVLSKPSDKPTMLNLCLENSSSYTCAPYVQYSTTGQYEAAPKILAFWQFDKVDWTQGINKVVAILKNDQEMKVQGDPAFYPTKLKLVVVVTAQAVP